RLQANLNCIRRGHAHPVPARGRQQRSLEWGLVLPDLEWQHREDRQLRPRDPYLPELH
ncbi:unnamed protein product, partial [Effrenium voratum]